MTDINMIQLKNIKKSYLLEGKRIEVLKNINFNINKGESIALIGRSGAGKTTLINILATLEFPDSGEMLINGKNPFGFSDKKLSLFRNEVIGIVFQFHHLLPEFTALENVKLPLMIAKKNKNADEKAMEILKKVGLEHRLNHKPAELSGGEQQRVAVARAIIRSPRLLLMDEPTGNLDKVSGEGVLELIFDLSKQYNLTTALVTHDNNLAKKMNRLFELKKGEVWEI